MQQPDQPVLQDIVLLGGGHSHVGVLRQFAMNPVPGVRLTLICRDTDTPYSGMLPGYIAGHYSHDDIHIDLSRLAEFAGARFYRDEAIGLDTATQQVICRDRPPVSYDLLSINIGSSPRTAGVKGAAEHAVPVKPINRFNRHWLDLLDRIKQHQGPFTLAVVGAGAGGVEMALAMQYRLHNELRNVANQAVELHVHILDAADTILPTHNPKVRALFERTLAERGVNVHLGAAVTEVTARTLQIEGEKTPLMADEVLWVTRAGGPKWLAQTGLALDDGLFIRVRNTLQVENSDRIFAVGDIANMTHHPREKAGVFAVRQGKPLADNLRRMALGKTPLNYHPQKKWLALISTGDRYAVASRGKLSVSGALVWHFKDQIDRRFMKKFIELSAMPNKLVKPNTAAARSTEDAAQALSLATMRCGGCGAKVGSTVLSRALSKLQPVNRDDVIVGLHAPDDAAVLRMPPGKAIVQTVDFFRAFIDDPYLFGQIAANHSLGDIFAMGATPQSATAIATVPYGIESKVEEQIYQMMAGAVSVLNDACCALVGGHTGEGQELALGFAVNGLIDPAVLMSKGGMQPGDAIILTKPIGTGTLLVAHAQLIAKGRWIDAALRCMVQSSASAAECFRQHDATACTDVTGFGLLGHLAEMLRPSGCAVELNLATIPLLDGALETSSQGILSSLHIANSSAASRIEQVSQWQNHPVYPLLFDPQTAGGLLASVPANNVEDCLMALRQRGYAHAAVVGVVKKGEAWVIGTPTSGTDNIANADITLVDQ
ncbi:MAG: selenide,water dikinase [Marinobacter psychrophilus]|jgi:selenide,water dikinase